ncbi:hypothetical protein HMPREF1624_00783 [Sporothrix schenckii ATCC 58251]|uniref:Anaphase-promoting complex subunit 4 WD40 domain-containing protein n=1 Tax=Sporothrix schenckii (strain ATCC 58251 / de Perez 2211183) TaxID=1391915 RepID=U7Q3N5_SPOS1|nr:hypothetical protein HMPREF1624_00783 [Sporothrix schenckii ATCC 58251]
MEVDEDAHAPEEVALPLRSPRRPRSPQMSRSSTPIPQQASSSPHVSLVAAAELHENQRWKPTSLHPGPAFKTIEWSADGTTVIASTASKSILSYVLPTDLLEPQKDDADNNDGDSNKHASSPYTPRHHILTCHGRLRFGITPSALAPAPYFSLAEPWSQSVLVGFRDRPIQLYPLFPEGGDSSDDDSSGEDDVYTRPTAPLASYSLVKHETEAYLPPMALLWSAPGTHFVVGTKSLLALFDASRTGNDPPLLRVPTVMPTGGGFSLGLRGTVSALAAGTGVSQNLTAAGTWTRGIGLYDLTRAGTCTAHWKVSADSGDAAGDGVVQTLWSPCGRYLVVNERKSSGLLVYDIRGSGKLLCTLAGRSARVSQPIRATVYESSHANGFELWSGTDHGAGVLYEGVGTRDGVVDPTWQWQAHGRSMVGGAAMHASGSVLATCASSPPVPDDDEGSDEDSDDDDDRDVESNESDEDSADDSETSSADSNVPSRAARPRTTVSDPSIKIWSLVPLQDYDGGS